MSNKFKFKLAETESEWNMVRHLRQKYFFDRVPIDDPYTWTFKHYQHIHFVLYKGTQIIGYAHIQLWPESRAAMRIIVIDEPYRNNGIGREFLKLCEQWLIQQNIKKLLVQSSPTAYQFYCNNGYIKMPFNDPDGYETDPQDIEVGKRLMTKHIIITGAMGSGKSTVIKLLEASGLHIIEEPAREILAEQRSIQDDGLPERNPKLFTQLLLSRAIYQFKQMQHMHNIVVYDRGIPDNIAYAKLFNLDYPPAQNAAKIFRYTTNVFFFPAWKEIYTTDDERIIPFDEAKKFGDDLKQIYIEYDYKLIEVPFLSPGERAQFIIDKINEPC